MRTLLSTLLLLLAALPAAAENWPRFRGPNGAGASADKDVPVQWTADAVRWKVAIPGHGNSSPIVWGDRIFLHTAAADGSERTLLCLDTADGKVVWKQTSTGARSRTHQKNSLASSTPVADAERVYIVFWDGKETALHAFDHKGKALWQRNLGTFTSQHGPGGSPMVHGGKVYYANDQDGKATLVAFDAATGRPAWEAPRKAFRASYSTPFVRQLTDGKVELLVTSTAGVAGYDPESGKENWSWEFGQARQRAVASSVAAEDGTVFMNAGNGEGDRTLAAIRAGAGAEALWKNTHGSMPYVPCMLTRGDHLYYVTDRGFAACHVANSGEQVWTERLGGNVTASPVLIDGKVYTVSDAGDVYVFAAEPKFKLLGKSAIGESVSASPAVADGRLYVRGREHLFCIARPTK